MATGTPLDLTRFGPFVSVLAFVNTIGWGYLLFAVGALGLTLLLAIRWQIKVLIAALMTLGLLYPLIRQGSEREAQVQSAADKLNASMALFKERCKSAGETIKRTVDGVDGVVWLKWREAYSNHDNFADQFKLNDPYGRDCGMEDCIARLLRVTSGAALDPQEASRHVQGYGYVETTDPRDGKNYRYTASIRSVHTRTSDELEQYKKNTGRDPGPYVYGYALDRRPVHAFSAEYGITWSDLSTRQDREHWVAGGALRIVEMKTADVVAERVGYMIDRGQGNQAEGRSPWLFAVESACPEFPSSGDGRHGRSLYDVREFAQKVLRPVRGN